MVEKTLIQVSKSTATQLKALQVQGESYEKVIVRMLGFVAEDIRLRKIIENLNIKIELMKDQLIEAYKQPVNNPPKETPEIQDFSEQPDLTPEHPDV